MEFLIKKDIFYIKIADFYKKMKKYLDYEIFKKACKIQSVKYYNYLSILIKKVV